MNHKIIQQTFNSLLIKFLTVFFSLIKTEEYCLKRKSNVIRNEQSISNGRKIRSFGPEFSRILNIKFAVKLKANYLFILNTIKIFMS